MERKFYNTDFESLLKENADQFKMYPSKKVWHGIYNDMHPGRRWPSVAMSFFLAFTLLIVGHLNTQEFENPPLSDLAAKKTVEQTSKTNGLKSTSKQTVKTNKQSIIPGKEGMTAPVIFVEGKNQVPSAIIPNKLTNEQNSSDDDEHKYASSVMPSVKSVAGILEKPEVAAVQSLKDNPVSNYNNRIPVIQNADIAIPNTLSGVNLISPEINDDLKSAKDNISQQKESIISVNTTNSNSQNQISKTIGLFKPRSGKLKWAYYFTPSVSYRSLSNITNFNQASSYYNDINEYVDHTAAPGFEAGAVIKYTLKKKLKFVSGLQLNYSSYNIHANNIHPMLATLMVQKPGSAAPSVLNGISFFSNSRGYSPAKLHNYSFQASIPVGLEYIISENNYVQFSAAASLQPSYVIASHSYLLSSDKRNYLTHPSLLRHFNLNTGAGLFVTFKSKLLDLQVGPQLRYQLLSTYTKAYPVSEHLINYGIRFSVSKTIK